MREKVILGIDVGGSGIKGAIVDVEEGRLLSERIKVGTPEPSTPEAISETFVHLIRQLGWTGEVIGCGFPAIVKEGIALSASNIHGDWIGVNIAELFGRASGCEIHVCNDADAAGMAEMKFGKGKDKEGTILMITIGTGLGSALFSNGRLVQNTELGQLLLNGQIAEQYASNSARVNNDLSWEEWGNRFNKFLIHVEMLFTPDLVILGGGISKKFNLYSDCLSIQTPVTPAAFLNASGVIGAAMFAHEKAMSEAF